MEDEVARALDRTLGQALYGSLAQSALRTLLVKKGIVSPAEAVSVIDSILLALERQRGHHLSPASGPGAIDHALSHLQARLESLRKFPQS